MRRDEPATMMHLIRPALLLIALLLLLLFADRAAADSVRVHDLTGANGPDITLRQIAELEGDYAEGFGDVVVGTMDEAMDEVEIEWRAIESALRGADAAMGRLEMHGYASCRVVRTQRSLPEVLEPEADQVPIANPDETVEADKPVTVRSEIERTLVETLGIDAHELRFTYRDRDSELLRSSAVAGRFRVGLLNDAQLGAQNVEVMRYEGSRVAGDYTVSVTVERRVMAIVVREPISRHGMIRREFVAVQPRWVDRDPGVLVSDVNQVVGQVASFAVRRGDMVTASAIQAPLAIRRNENVQVTLQQSGVRVSFTALAQDEGAVGDQIQVRNRQTGESTQVEITGRQTARVVSGTQDNVENNTGD